MKITNNNYKLKIKKHEINAKKTITHFEPSSSSDGWLVVAIYRARDIRRRQTTCDAFVLVVSIYSRQTDRQTAS